MCAVCADGVLALLPPGIGLVGAFVVEDGGDSQAAIQQLQGAAEWAQVSMRDILMKASLTSALWTIFQIMIWQICVCRAAGRS